MQGWTLLFLAIVLGDAGAVDTFGPLRGKRQGNFALMCAISSIAGVAVILMPLFGFGLRLTAAWLLAIGLLAAGVLAIMAPFFEAHASKRGDLLMAISCWFWRLPSTTSSRASMSCKSWRGVCRSGLQRP